MPGVALGTRRSIEGLAGRRRRVGRHPFRDLAASTDLGLALSGRDGHDAFAAFGLAADLHRSLVRLERDPSLLDVLVVEGNDLARALFPHGEGASVLIALDHLEIRVHANHELGGGPGRVVLELGGHVLHLVDSQPAENRERDAGENDDPAAPDGDPRQNRQTLLALGRGALSCPVRHRSLLDDSASAPHEARPLAARHSTRVAARNPAPGGGTGGRRGGTSWVGIHSLCVRYKRVTDE